uniref:RxLR effector candidate protein n=1 Tax=Hyaloperonospora arabidopsidis (strain Emoy2) TaxID=559515 RepID=M4B7D8_HYAAE
MLLKNSAACSHKISISDGYSLHLTRVGSVRLKLISRCLENIVTLTNVYLAPRLATRIISYGSIKRMSFSLVYDGEKVALARCSEGKLNVGNAIMVVLEDGSNSEAVGDVQERTEKCFECHI